MKILSVTAFALFLVLPLSNAEAAVITTGALTDYLQITPADGGEHGPGPAFDVSIDNAAAGTVSWSDTFNDSLEMGPDGTIGYSEDPYIGRSWSDQTGSIIYDLSGLDISNHTVANIGLEFHSHENLKPYGSGIIALYDGSILLASIFCSPDDQFGPWSFVIPYADFLATSKNLTVEMTLSPMHYGQWHAHGVAVQEGSPVPLPSPLLLLGSALIGIWGSRKNIR